MYIYPHFLYPGDWNQRKDYADGHATSLYERSSNDEKSKFIGDPVADALAVVTRRDSCILALADGVSWGQKSKLASTCSIYGSVTYLNDYLHTCKNTKDVFRCILQAFEKAQYRIVSEQATMTTLCVAVVVPLSERNRWALCVVNVGDSYAYVYNKEKGVKEVTESSHPIDEKRDMRQSGGALGPADGYNPDLGNLTCSFMMLEKGDLVFLCSDGVSDNFDPTIARFTPKLQRRDNQTTDGGKKGKSLLNDPSFEVIHSDEDGKETNDKDSMINESVSNNRNTQTPIIITDDVDVDNNEFFSVGQRMCCDSCLNEQLNKNPLNIPILSEQQRKRSQIWDFFPDISDKKKSGNQNNCSSNEEEEVNASSVCTKCGNVIQKELSEDVSNNLQTFSTTLPKISSTSSMDKIKELGNEQNDDFVLKSSSFSSDNSIANKASGVHRHEKEPSMEFGTGKKNKEEESLRESLTCRERREAALERMTEVWIGSLLMSLFVSRYSLFVIR